MSFMQLLLFKIGTQFGTCVVSSGPQHVPFWVIFLLLTLFYYALNLSQSHIGSVNFSSETDKQRNLSLSMFQLMMTSYSVWIIACVSLCVLTSFLLNFSVIIRTFFIGSNIIVQDSVIEIPFILYTNHFGCLFTGSSLGKWLQFGTLLASCRAAGYTVRPKTWTGCAPWNKHPCDAGTRKYRMSVKEQLHHPVCRHAIYQRDTKRIDFVITCSWGKFWLAQIPLIQHFVC